MRTHTLYSLQNRFDLLLLTTTYRLAYIAKPNQTKPPSPLHTSTRRC